MFNEKELVFMLTITDQQQGNIIEVSFSGEISVEEYQKVNRLIEKHKEEYGHIHMLLQLNDFMWDSVEAMIEDLKLSLTYFSDFKKLAIVSNKQWIKFSAEVIDELIPSIDMKMYDFAEISEARGWLLNY